MDKNYLKNDCYTIDAVKQAEQLANEFHNGSFKPKLLKRGNHKLPKNVACWDLPCRVTCKYNCPNCYALKAERQYKNTPIMRAYHYEIVKQALQNSYKYDFFMDYILQEFDRHIIYCNRKGLIPICRIHSSGDIFSKEYLELLLELINLLPDINFYTYTKQLDNRTIDKLNKINNLNIVKSIVEVNGKNCINYGSLDYITKLSKELDNSFICGYGIDDTQKCMVNCNACLHCPHVLFKQH